MADPPGFGAAGPRLSEVGESGLLRRLLGARRGAAAAGVLLGPGDDAALWQPPAGEVLALTQDALVEGVDFRREWMPPYLLGRRCLALSLSDLAAMGATPAWCLVTLCADGSTSLGDVEEVHRGLQDMAAEHGCPVIGGDLSAIEGPLVLDVVAGGTVAPGRALRRDAGRAGDALVVTGVVGRAAAGLWLLLAGGGSGAGAGAGAAAGAGGAVRAEGGAALAEAGHAVPAEVAAAWRSAQLDPCPRLAEGRELAARGVRCAGDVSDGLLVDARRTADASGTGAELWRDALPVDAALRQAFGDEWAALALGGGEDFELLAAVPAAEVDALRRDWPSQLAPLSVVGRLVEGSGLRLLDREGGTELALPAVVSRHFAS